MLPDVLRRHCYWIFFSFCCHFDLLWFLLTVILATSRKPCCLTPQHVSAILTVDTIFSTICLWAMLLRTLTFSTTFCLFFTSFPRVSQFYMVVLLFFLYLFLISLFPQRAKSSYIIDTYSTPGIPALLSSCQWSRDPNGSVQFHITTGVVTQNPVCTMAPY